MVLFGGRRGDAGLDFFSGGMKLEIRGREFRRKPELRGAGIGRKQTD